MRESSSTGSGLLLIVIIIIDSKSDHRINFICAIFLGQPQNLELNALPHQTKPNQVEREIMQQQRRLGWRDSASVPNAPFLRDSLT